jgi:hypothetical protein
MVLLPNFVFLLRQICPVNFLVRPARNIISSSYKCTIFIVSLEYNEPMTYNANTQYFYDQKHNAAVYVIWRFE